MFQWLSLFGQLGVWLLLCFYLVGSLGWGWWVGCCCAVIVVMVGRVWFVFVEIVVVVVFVIWIVSVC